MERPHPPTDDPGALLAQAERLVEEALALGEAGDWERVGELDRRTLALIERMAARLADRDPEPYASGLVRLRDRHHALRRLAEQQRERLMEDRRKSVRGRAGTRAYEENA